MSVSVTWNGSSYTIPQTGEVGWGTNLTNYLVALPAGALQKTGGSFTLAAETDFGATYGLKAAYFLTRTAAPASAGVVRLAKTDSVGWRNNANSADLALSINGSDQLLFNGAIISATCANPALSNLASVAINTDLLPAGDESINLGSSSKRWVALYTKAVTMGGPSDVGILSLYDNSGSYISIYPSAQGGNYTYQIPNAGSNANFVMSEGTATINGNKTFGGTVSVANTNLKIGANACLPIMQVVQATTGAGSAITANTMTNTALAVTITPKYSTSKILIHVSGVLGNNGGTATYLTLARGATNLSDASGFAQLSTFPGIDNVGFTYYDSPATTSATTYTVQIRSGTSGQSSYFPNSGTGIISAMELAQ